MNPERWQQLREIFEAALDRDPSSRTDFLDSACRTDPQLRKEVQALLDNSDDNFLEKPAYQSMPELFESDAGDALVGKQLGPYAVTAKLGQGGMGVVYLARDTRLDRQVAIKMLAPQYTRDSQQRERLKREARAAAKLSHPGIAAVYSLEEYGDDSFIVYEYVHGCTLHQDAIGKPLPLPALLDTAIQIARALVAAHEFGIVHRDLKPDNIARTEHGVVKILDFGLARIGLVNGAEKEVRLTRSGVFLGTPAYASPEQLLGNEYDFRTDIFSFGVLLFELASGKHPFGAPDSISTIARILEGEAPGLNQMNPATPKALDRIVQRCLHKNPADRYVKTRDLLADLEKLSETVVGKQQGLPSAGVVDTRKDSGRLLWWWQFHQACAGFGYYGMIYPLWRVKQWVGGAEGSLLFFPVLIAVGVAANLRLHLWFTSKFYPVELQEQRRSVSRWIRYADWLFVVMLASNAVLLHTQHAIIATLLMAVAIGSLVAFMLIEPTTARAALDKNQ